MAHTLATVKIQVDVECEACACQYTYRKQYSSSTKGWSGDRAVAKIQGQIGSGDLGFKRCPKCKYLQSWMHSSRSATVSSVGSLIGFFAALLSGPAYQSTPFWPQTGWGKLLILVANCVAWIVVSGMVANFLFPPNAPNARWHKKHGPDEPGLKVPRWNYVR